MNSAGGLSRPKLKPDLEKLSVAKTYLDGRFPGSCTVALLLVVATACKDAKSEGGGLEKIARLQGWMEDAVFTEEIPSNVTVALVLSDRVVWIAR